MNSHRKLLISILTVWLVVAAAYDAWLYHLPSHTTDWNFSFNIIWGLLFLAGGLFGIINGIRLSLSSNLGKTLFFFGLALFFFAMGNVVWIYYNFVAKVAIPFPSWDDAVYGLIYPSNILGAIFLARVYQPLINKQFFYRLAAITIIVFALIFVFFAKPDLSPGLSSLQKFLDLYYPIADSVSITLAFSVLTLSNGKLSRGLYLIALGLLLNGSGDLLYTSRAAQGIYWNGDIPDMIFTVYAYVASVGLIETMHDLQPAKLIGKNQTKL